MKRTLTQFKCDFADVECYHTSTPMIQSDADFQAKDKALGEGFIFAGDQVFCSDHWPAITLHHAGMSDEISIIHPFEGKGFSDLVSMTTKTCDFCELEIRKSVGVYQNTGEHFWVHVRNGRAWLGEDKSSAYDDHYASWMSVTEVRED